jgi:hypothetical protein
MIEKRRKYMVVFDTYMLMASIAGLSEEKNQALIDMLNESFDDGDYIGISEHTRRMIKLFGLSDAEYNMAHQQARMQAQIREEIRSN